MLTLAFGTGVVPSASVTRPLIPPALPGSARLMPPVVAPALTATMEPAPKLSRLLNQRVAKLPACA